MENVRKRIQSLLKQEKTTVNKLAVRHHLNQSTLNNQINASAAITVSTILLLLNDNPDLSAEWLLRGTGSMLLSELTTKNEEAELRDTIRRQQREIDGLYERIDELKRGSAQQPSVMAG